MDPRDRLWALLIFPHCDKSTLLALRAVCRALLAQLNGAPARLWHPMTMVDSRMRYGERLFGWRGVKAAMAREETSRANCDAGRFVRSEALHVRAAVRTFHVAGRGVAAFVDSVELYDLTSGAQEAAFAISIRRMDFQIVLDRYVTILTVNGPATLLDCLSATLLEIPTPLAGPTYFSASGARVSIRTPESVDVVVVQLNTAPNGATHVQRVATVRLPHVHDQFILCNGGQSYLLRHSLSVQIELFDVASGRLRHGFTAPRGFRLSAFQFFNECNFFLAQVTDTESEVMAGFVSFRISDGHCSALFQRTSAVLWNGSRVLAVGDSAPSHIADAVTGAVSPLRPMRSLLADSSGALVWRDGQLRMASGGPYANGSALVEMRRDEVFVCFRYGVALVRCHDECFAFRFDAPPH